MQHTKFRLALLISVMLAANLLLSPATSPLQNEIAIKSGGQISIPSITATSGYWKDIQAAIDWVVAHGGIGNVYIPAGTWNFVNVGETWTVNTARVDVPAGINIYGAPTERTSGLSYDGTGRDPNDQVVQWKTILKIPWKDSTQLPPDIGKNCFGFYGTGSPDKPSRMSDIEIDDYEPISSPYTDKPGHGSVWIRNVVNYRIDHCAFIDLGIGARVSNSSGVFDHCNIANLNGYVVDDWGSCTVVYGITIQEDHGYWETDPWQVLGHYTRYTTFIENCYFEKWRHCTCGNWGGHYVFRHNTIYHDYGYGSIDAHGSGTPCTRATEIYNNSIRDAIQYGGLAWMRGGAGVAFDNTVGGGTYYNYFVYLSMTDGPSQTYKPHIWYIWDNTLLGSVNKQVVADSGIVEGTDYWQYAPSSSNYTPYVYPFPLTLSATP